MTSSVPSALHAPGRPPRGSTDTNRQTRFNLFYVALALLGVLFFQDLWARSQAVAAIPYSQFQALVRAGDVEKEAPRAAQAVRADHRRTHCLRPPRGDHPAEPRAIDHEERGATAGARPKSGPPDLPVRLGVIAVSPSAGMKGL